MAASAISNLLRKNVGAGLARVSLNKNIIRNYFSLVFSVDKRAFKRRVWFDFKFITPGPGFQVEFEMRLAAQAKKTYA